MKKVLLLVGAVAIVLVTVPLFAAFEAHVINVTARIENALYVHPQSLNYQTVFPQEHLYTSFFIDFSGSFSANNQLRVGIVEYVIKQKPQCVDTQGNNPQVQEDENGNFVCPVSNGLVAILKNLSLPNAQLFTSEAFELLNYDEGCCSGLSEASAYITLRSNSALKRFEELLNQDK